VTSLDACANQTNLPAQQQTKIDEHYMRMALQVAQFAVGQTSPNPLVGAVLVKDGQVIAQGAHLKAGSPHAEVHALRMAAEQATGATLYVTLEPCSHHGRTPPCAEAVVAAGVGRVVMAMEDLNPEVAGRGRRLIEAAGIAVTTGVMAEESAQMNEAYITWRRRNRPFVVWKCAATLDGYTATPSGHAQFVTGEAARLEVQSLRRTLPAIAVGVGTVLADDPLLTVRPHASFVAMQPLRVVFDSHLRLPSTARMLSAPGRTLVYTTESADAIARKRGTWAADIAVDMMTIGSDSAGRILLQEALQDLGRRGITGVLLEGGGTIASSFLSQQLIDKVVYYISPKLLGGGIPAIGGLLPQQMEHAVQLRGIHWRTVGDDMCIEGYPIWLDGKDGAG